MDKDEKIDHAKQNHMEIYVKPDLYDMDLAINVFFHVTDLYSGKKIPIYCAVNDPSTTPRLLTLKQCKWDAKPGETRFCASSLDSMVDLTREVLGMVNVGDIVSCHTMAYPYAVYYCYGQKEYNRVFEISFCSNHVLVSHFVVDFQLLVSHVVDFQEIEKPGWRRKKQQVSSGSRSAAAAGQQRQQVSGDSIRQQAAGQRQCKQKEATTNLMKALRTNYESDELRI
ncbi:hypothetical protein QVD17_41912 [Tagetes erecta]|uniref:BURP domain-containing protein n=1 Tax=Tagetes erecta TaxID=13708 RepID=A0AAD8NDZ6_TARER|nr:hypothetical protein QVD17_41912 [Tagetes erecta]